MQTKTKRRAFKGGLGFAVAVFAAWVLEASTGVVMPGEVAAALGSIVGSLISTFRE